MDISTLIKNYRIEHKMSLRDFANKCGVSHSYISMLESRKNSKTGEPIVPTIAMLQKIASGLGISINELFSICDDMPVSLSFENKESPREDTLSEGERYLIDLFRKLQDKIPGLRPITKRRIPLLGNVACGEPILAEEQHDTYVDISADFDADFCLTATGDSMINARIFDGDILFVKQADQVDNGEIAVVLIEDEATVKRVYYDRENNIVTLMPENPMHKPMRYTGADLDKIRILGRVIFGQYTLR